MSKPELTEKEAYLVNNIVNKLQIYMDKTGQSLHSLSANLGFEYQPFYRLMKNRKLPTISSVAMITDHLGCSIEELISDKMLTEVKIFDNFEEVETKLNIEGGETVKIYVPIQEYIPNVKNDFFAVKTESLKTLDIDICRLYSTVNSINLEGVYTVKQDGRITELNIISTSTKFVIAEANNQEIRISQDSLIPIAKFVKLVILLKSSNNYLQGFKE